MPNIDAPRGFKPLRHMSGTPFNGSLEPYRLASGYNTNLFVGDVVKLLTTGFVAKANPGDLMRGVVAGIYWVGAGGIPGQQRYWPAGTVTATGTDAQVLVVDDPTVLFEAAFTNSASIPSVADIGATFNLIDQGGNPANSLSGQGIDYATGGTGAAQFRFVDFVKRADNDTASSYSRGLFTPALHDLRVNTGV